MVVVGVWWNVVDVIVSLIILVLCCTIGIVCGLSVGRFLENGPP